MGRSATPLAQLATMESEIEQVDRWTIGAGNPPLYDGPLRTTLDMIYEN
jgi:hypothetical protein